MHAWNKVICTYLASAAVMIHTRLAIFWRINGVPAYATRRLTLKSYIRLVSCFASSWTRHTYTPSTLFWWLFHRWMSVSQFPVSLLHLFPERIFWVKQHSFYGPGALLITQPTASKHWRKLNVPNSTRENHLLASSSSFLHPTVNSRWKAAAPLCHVSDATK